MSRRAYVGGLAEGLGKIRWCSTVKAAVHQNAQPKLDPLRNLQPVQFTEEWGNARFLSKGNAMGRPGPSAQNFWTF